MKWKYLESNLRVTQWCCLKCIILRAINAVPLTLIFCPRFKCDLVLETRPVASDAVVWRRLAETPLTLRGRRSFRRQQLRPATWLHWTNVGSPSWSHEAWLQWYWTKLFSWREWRCVRGTRRKCFRGDGHSVEQEEYIDYVFRELCYVRAEGVAV